MNPEPEKKTCGPNRPPFPTLDPNTSCSGVTLANVSGEDREAGSGGNGLCIAVSKGIFQPEHAEFVGITCVQISGSRLGYNIN